MIVLSLVIFLLAILFAAVFLEPVRIHFYLDTDELDMHATARWTSMLSLNARVINYRLFITVRLFGKKVSAQFLKKGKKARTGTNIFEALALSDTRVEVSYGLNDPFLTGIFCAAADFAGALMRNAGITLEPDFLPDSEFLRVAAATSLNIGDTIVNLVKLKLRKRRTKYGSAA
jgi:hypothetical protein